MVEEQWKRIVKFSNKIYVTNFISDINNWDNNINTINNNF